jgi:phage tail sheath protein FI
MTRRWVEAILDSINIWLNGLVAAGVYLGARVEFLDAENPTTSLMAGKATFHIYATPPSPGKEILFITEYDVSYVKEALGG